MARVADASGNFPQNAPTSGMDRVLSKPNRNMAGTPYGTTTPLYAGELVQDTTIGQIWVAAGLTTTDWVAVTKVV